MGAILPPGVDPLPANTLVAADIGVTVQAFDLALTTLAAAPTGLLAKTSPTTITSREIVGTNGRVDVTDGSGIAGDPTISSPQDTGVTATPTFAGITTTGGVYRAVRSIGSGNQTVLATDHKLLASATAGDVNLVLPPAGDGPREIEIKLIDTTAGLMIITAAVTNTIDGSPVFVMGSIFQALVLQSDGVSGWLVFATVADGIKTINSRLDLPPAVAGGIPISEPYFVKGFTELAGEHLVWLPGGSMQGMNPQVDGFVSTGLVGGALVRSTSTMTARRVAFIGVAVALDLDGISAPDNAISWREIAFIGCGSIGTIQNYSFFLWKDVLSINSGTLTLDGTFSAALFHIGEFSPVPDGVTAIMVLATATFTRRFEVSTVAMAMAGAASVGINFALGATVPGEAYVLRDCSIEGGGGTPLIGKLEDDNAAMFENNRGFPNSTTQGGLSMEGNATATVIVSPGVYVKVAGTTIASPDNARFTHTNGRLTHTGEIAKTFFVILNITLTGGSNNDVAAEIGTNGTVIGTPTRVPLGTGGDGSPLVVHATVLLDTGEYLEPFVANEGGTTNITATELVLTAVPA